MNQSTLLSAGLEAGLTLGLVEAIANIVWQWTHPHGYWTYGILGRQWHNPRQRRYW